MRFVRTGEFRTDALERLVEISPQKEILNLFHRMNYLLGFIKERDLEMYPKYVDNLLAKYRSLLKDGLVKSNLFSLDKLVSDNTIMNNHLELAKVVLNYYLQTLQLPENVEEKTKVVTKNHYQSFLYIRYHNLLVLTETLERADAIALYKKFVTYYILDKRNPNRETYANLESWGEKAIEREKTPSEWVIIRGMIGDGKYAYRNDNCTWVDALKDLPDSDLKYYVSCYGDYEGIKGLHDSMVLTMEHTIAQGDPYCSRVIHDTRVNWDLRHPPKSFWDSMKPDNE